MAIRLIQPNEPTGGAARATVDWIAGDAASFHQVRDTVEDVGVVILQHEYGIYGGPDGDEILDLLRTTTTPSIVVLHTVLTEPTPHQRAVLEEVIARADGRPRRPRRRVSGSPTTRSPIRSGSP